MAEVRQTAHLDSGYSATAYGRDSASDGVGLALDVVNIVSSIRPEQSNPTTVTHFFAFMKPDPPDPDFIRQNDRALREAARIITNVSDRSGCSGLR